MFKKTIGKIIAFTMAGLLAFSSVEVTAISATNNANEISNFKLDDKLEQEVIDAYAALLYAYKTGSTKDLLFAYSLIAKLTPTQCVRLFVLKYQDYYKVHYLDDNFMFFDVEKYIKAHPELLNKGKTVEEQQKAALQYYLEYGIFQGDSSCTTFDPIVAIIAHPKNVIGAMVGNPNGTDSLLNMMSSYAAVEGSISTEIYDVDSTFPDDINKKLTSKDGILYLNKKVINRTAPSSAQEETKNVEPDYFPWEIGDYDDLESDVVYVYDDDEDYIPGDIPEKPIPPYDNVDAINNHAKTHVNSYQLNMSPNVSGTRQIVTGNEGIHVEYFADEYLGIKDKLSNKYTMMVYLCGSDLESDGGSGTDDIVSILASLPDLSKVNVVICAGGSNKWSSSYLDANSGNLKTAVYYLDTDGLSADKKQNPSAITSNDLNENTLKLLARVNDPVDMGNAELFEGFLNLSADLFPAENYWLSLWNHGGGSSDGICFSDSSDTVKGIGLDYGRIEIALRDSRIGKIDILSMDACLMGGLEGAYNLSPYVSYMIASEEMTNGAVTYKEYLAAIQNDSKNNAQKAMDGAEAYIITHLNENSDVISTNAAYDLQALSRVNGIMREFGNVMSELITDENTADKTYQMVRKAAARSKMYGANNGDDHDFVDMRDFFDNLTVYMSLECKKNDITDDEKHLYEFAMKKISELEHVNFILYSGAVYDTNKIYDLKGGLENESSANSVVTYSAIWNSIFGGNLSGVNLFIPFRRAGYANATSGNEYVRNSSVVNYVNEEIFDSYANFIDEYSKKAETSAEIARIDRILNSIKTDEDHYEDVFSDMKFVHTSSNGNLEAGLTKDHVNNRIGNRNYIEIDFRNIYRDSANDGSVGYMSDSVDPYTDFMETVKNINMTVTKRDSAKIAGETVAIDLVVGSTSVTPEQIEKSNIRVEDGKLIEDTSLMYSLDNRPIYGYWVSGNVVGETDPYHASNKYIDWATAVKDFYSNADYSNLFGEGTKYNTDNVLVVDGRFYFDNNGSEGYEDAYLLFSNLTTSTTPVPYYYIGATYYDKVDNTFELYDDTEHGITAIDFYHYFLNGNKIEKLENSGYTIDTAVKYDIKTVNITMVSLTDASDTMNDYNKYVAEVETFGGDNQKSKLVYDDKLYQVDEGKYNQNVDTVGNKVETTPDVDVPIEDLVNRVFGDGPDDTEIVAEESSDIVPSEEKEFVEITDSFDAFENEIAEGADKANEVDEVNAAGEANEVDEAMLQKASEIIKEASTSNILQNITVAENESSDTDEAGIEGDATSEIEDANVVEADSSDIENVAGEDVSSIDNGEDNEKVSDYQDASDDQTATDAQASYDNESNVEGNASSVADSSSNESLDNATADAKTEVKPDAKKTEKSESANSKDIAEKDEKLSNEGTSEIEVIAESESVAETDDTLAIDNESDAIAEAVIESVSEQETTDASEEIADSVNADDGQIQSEDSVEASNDEYQEAPAIDANLEGSIDAVVDNPTETHEVIVEDVAILNEEKKDNEEVA